MRGRSFQQFIKVSLLMLAASGPAAALDLNGFQPEAGRGDVAFSLSIESYDEFWVGETKVSDPGVGKVDTTSFTVWIQWGFTDDLALVANLPYVEADSDGAGGFGESSLQDLSALLKVRFARWGGGGSAQHSLVGAVGGRVAASDYEDNQPVDVGDGTSDVLLRLVYQVEAGAFYFSQQVGYDLRGGDAPDGFPLYTELGYTFGQVTLNAYYLDYIADGGTDIGDPGFTFPSNQDETTRFGAKLYGRVSDRLGFSLLAFTTLDGRNSGDATGYAVGAVLRF
jgi:hypothetical protein